MAPMPLILARVGLTYTTSLPDDLAINTFAFDNQSATDPITGDLTDLLVNFYTATQATTLKVGNYISEVVSRTSGSATVSLAEIVDPGPVVDIGPTYYVDTWTLPAAGSGGTSVSLPLECAVVNSFKNDSETTVPAARRRGRIFLGPLDIISFSTTGPYPAIQSGCMDTLAQASEALRDAAAAIDCPWCVWSRADGQLYPVESGFINNEFDTQRRRAADATMRTTWS